MQTLVPSLMLLIGYHPFVDLSGQDISLKKENWTGKSGEEGISVIGAKLKGGDLRNANLWGVFLVNTDLSEADLTGARTYDGNFAGANLDGARLAGGAFIAVDLSNASFFEADLSGAKLVDADLTGAEISGADMTGTDLNGANLRYTTLRDIHGLSPGQIFSAKAWNQAFYDKILLGSVGLTADHNKNLEEQNRKEKSGHSSSVR